MPHHDLIQQDKKKPLMKIGMTRQLPILSAQIQLHTLTLNTV